MLIESLKWGLGLISLVPTIAAVINMINSNTNPKLGT